MSEEAPEELPLPAEFATYVGEDTMRKVYTALAEAGLGENEVLECINNMQNAGILFRERL